MKTALKIVTPLLLSLFLASACTNAERESDVMERIDSLNKDETGAPQDGKKTSGDTSHMGTGKGPGNQNK